MCGVRARTGVMQAPEQRERVERAVREARVDLAPAVARERAARLLQAREDYLGARISGCSCGRGRRTVDDAVDPRGAEAVERVQGRQDLDAARGGQDVRVVLGVCAERAWA
jgi:hypothetical protein